MSRRRIEEWSEVDVSGLSNFWTRVVGVKRVKGVRVVPMEERGESDFLVVVGVGVAVGERVCGGLRARSNAKGGAGERGKAVGDVVVLLVSRVGLLVAALPGTLSSSGAAEGRAK